LAELDYLCASAGANSGLPPSFVTSPVVRSAGGYFLTVNGGAPVIRCSAIRALYDSIPVRTFSGAEYIAEHGIDPESVNVLRMALEDYKTTVLQEFEEVLRAPGPLLLFVEVHPQLYDDDTIERLYSTFRDCGFDLVSAARNDRSLEVRTLREVEQADDWVELILRK
jgi:hypothetical protein